MNRFLDRWMQHLETQADGLTEAGRHAHAASTRVELCSGIERHLGADAPLLVDHLDALARCHRRAGQLADAETICRRRLRLIHRLHGRQHWAFAQGLNQLGVVYCEMGRYRRAAGLYRRVLAWTRRRVAADDPCLAALHHNLANAYQAIDERRRAQRHYEAALDLLKATAPSAEHAQCLCDLAEVVVSTSPADARRLLLDSLGELREVHADSPGQLARALIRVAGSYFRNRHVAMADQLLQEAVHLLESVEGDDSGELEHCLGLLQTVRDDSTP